MRFIPERFIWTTHAYFEGKSEKFEVNQDKNTKFHTNKNHIKQGKQQKINPIKHPNPICQITQLKSRCATLTTMIFTKEKKTS